MHVRYHIGKRQHQRDVSKKRGPTDSSSLGGHKYPAEGRQVRTVHNIQPLPSAPMLTGGDRFERDIVVVQARAAAQSQFLADIEQGDRKSTRLNSSHVAISYAVFCLKKKNRQHS